MVGALQEIKSTLAAVVADLNPSSVHASSVVGLFDELDQIERLASSAKTLLARRLEDTAEWRRSGHLSPAEFLAARSGTTITAAKDTITTSMKVAELPVVEQAMRDGQHSSQQAVAISDAAANSPAAQRRLVDAAKRSSLRELRDDCQRIKAAADPDRETTHARIHAGRHVRTFTDAEGAWNLHARGTVAAGARIEAALKPHIEVTRPTGSTARSPALAPSPSPSPAHCWASRS